MSSEQFEEIAARAEELAKRNPAAYRARLVAMAVGGYSFLIFILLVLLGLLAGIVAIMASSRHVNAVEIKIVVVLCVVVWLLLRSLWVKLAPPEGIKLDAGKYPALFEAVDAARKLVGAPPVSSVVMNGEFNASVAQTPRLGFFGWYRNQLTIGLPLMECMTPDEFRSVLAHEFGHLSGAHGKMGVWMYRIRQTWLQVVQNFAESGSAMTKVLLPFFKWFVPLLARADAPAGIRSGSLCGTRRGNGDGGECAVAAESAGGLAGGTLLAGRLQAGGSDRQTGDPAITAAGGAA
jgi:Zn-dependent protease with chaperone function